MTVASGKQYSWTKKDYALISEALNLMLVHPTAFIDAPLLPTNQRSPSIFTHLFSKNIQNEEDECSFSIVLFSKLPKKSSVEPGFTWFLLLHEFESFAFCNPLSLLVIFLSVVCLEVRRLGEHSAMQQWISYEGPQASHTADSLLSQECQISIFFWPPSETLCSRDWKWEKVRQTLQWSLWRCWWQIQFFFCN